MDGLAASPGRVNFTTANRLITCHKHRSTKQILLESALLFTGPTTTRKIDTGAGGNRLLKDATAKP
jgi:hypothetical protein